MPTAASSSCTPLQLGEAGVDLLLDGFPQGVLLGDELVGLVRLDLLLEGGDALGLGLVGCGDFGELGLELGDGGGLGLAGLGLQRGFFGAEVLEQCRRGALIPRGAVRVGRSGSSGRAAPRP